jgi:hypothetical protein
MFTLMLHWYVFSIVGKYASSNLTRKSFCAYWVRASVRACVHVCERAGEREGGERERAVLMAGAPMVTVFWKSRIYKGVVAYWWPYCGTMLITVVTFLGSLGF